MNLQLKDTLKINRFKDQMIIELENNSRKGSVFEWKGVENKIVDLEYHKAKLLFAIKEKNSFAIKEYIADCSNILLSIGDEYNLYNEDSLNQYEESIMLDPIIQIKELGKSEIKKLI